MQTDAEGRAWLLMAAGDDRGYGGNSGYDDQIDAYYSWDSKVPNHRGLQVGDPIALWDKSRLLGISVIEQIDQAPGTKRLSRCPACRAPQITERKQLLPRYRCSKCSHEFDQPRVEEVEVTRYTARYDAAWTPLDGVLDAAELRRLQKNPGEFNAMRALDWAAFRRALLDKNAGLALERVVGRLAEVDYRQGDHDVSIGGGFKRTLVRVRRGQRKFRQHLLATQGELCAFTGRAPDRVLEAGHLYSYARLGEHHEHGGLMLRRDIHRLFDDGLLAVEPSRARIDVSPQLASYDQYASLHDRPLQLDLRDQQMEWLTKHWDEHRQ